MQSKLIAPCGMNCNIWKYYHREIMKCPGCRIEDESKSKYCKECIIINCQEINNKNSDFCFKCSRIPCRRLINLDKRYKTKYHMSMLENLGFIKENGIKEFLEKEMQKWKCPKCNGTITCHGGMCLLCGYEKYKI